MNATEKEIKKLIKDINENAKSHGWWEEERSFGEIVALIHSELSEALEFSRSRNTYENLGVSPDYHYTNKQGKSANVKITDFKKPDGIIPELADVIIRIFDYVGHMDQEELLIKAVKEKHEYNKTRPYKHGNKLF